MLRVTFNSIALLINIIMIHAIRSTILYIYIFLHIYLTYKTIEISLRTNRQWYRQINVSHTHKHVVDTYAIKLRICDSNITLPIVTNTAAFNVLHSTAVDV